MVYQIAFTNTTLKWWSLLTRKSPSRICRSVLSIRSGTKIRVLIGCLLLLSIQVGYQFCPVILEAPPNSSRPPTPFPNHHHTHTFALHRIFQPLCLSTPVVPGVEQRICISGLMRTGSLHHPLSYPRSLRLTIAPAG